MALLNWIVLVFFIILMTVIVIGSDRKRKKQIEQDVFALLGDEWTCTPGGRRQVELPFESELPRESKAFSRQIPFFYRLSGSVPSSWLFGNITERSDNSCVMGNSIMMVKLVEHGPKFSFRIQQRIGGVFEDVRDSRFAVCETVKLKNRWFICKFIGFEGGDSIGKDLLDTGIPNCVRMVQLSGGYLFVSGESAYRKPNEYVELLNAAENIYTSLNILLVRS